MGGYVFGNGGPSWNGIPMIGGAQPDFSGNTWFVDSVTGSDGNTGLSWAKPFKTLAYAISVNNNAMASAGMANRRSTIFIAGVFTESLAVFPNNCDIIGAGNSPMLPMAEIVGIASPANVQQSARFYNVHFVGGAGTASIVSMGSNTSGNEFHGCIFTCGTTQHNTAISVTGSLGLVVKKCQFVGGFSAAYIYFHAGDAGNVIVSGNTMCEGTSHGIWVEAGTVVDEAVISGNIISCAQKCINDLSGVFFITRNNGFTAAPKGTNGAGGFVGALTKMQDNRLTASDVNNAIVPAEGTL